MATGAEESWDYSEADTQQHVHGIHIYPARMIPQIANRLIRNFSKPGDLVLDPFCGSGSVLVEALVLGRNAIGIDINPLACLIAKVKTTPLNIEKLKSLVQRVLENLSKKGFMNDDKIHLPAIPSASHWFKPNVLRALAIIKSAIDETINKDLEQEYYDFFRVCFSMTVRRSSNIASSDNPYFIRALTGEKLRKHNPDPFKIFNEQLKEGVKRIEEFSKLIPNNVKAKVLLGDARSLPLNDEEADIVVTSPPYGEESHTMSYTRFAKLSLYWLGYTSRQIKEIEKCSLGGTKFEPYSLSEFPEFIQKLYEKVRNKNKKRATEMLYFLSDYARSLKEIKRVLVKGGYACVVIGDRSVAGIPIPNGLITVHMGEQIGLKHMQSFTRTIPKKVLPRRDYKVELINKENIVILKKE